MSGDLTPTPTPVRVPIEPFALHRLPRVPGSTAELIRDISLRRRFLEQPREIMLSPFGRIAIRCLDVGAPSPYRKDCESWGIIRAVGSERPGVLVCERMTAMRIIFPGLGLPVPRAARRLGTMERGIAAAVFAAVVRGISNDLALTVHRPGRLRDDLARVTLALDIAGYREYVHLHLPPYWLPRNRSAELPAEAARRGLDIPLQVEFGRTKLPFEDWSRAERGDAVLFDGVPFPSQHRPSILEVWCGDYVASAELSPDGVTNIRSSFTYRAGRRRRQRPSPERSLSSMPPSITDRSALLEALMAAPIEVVAEVGRVVVSAEDVLALAPGAVLPLGWLRSDSVSLRVGDRTWARGELVDLEGQLGVRVTEILDHTPPPPSGDTKPVP